MLLVTRISIWPAVRAFTDGHYMAILIVSLVGTPMRQLPWYSAGLLLGLIIGILSVHGCRVHRDPCRTAVYRAPPMF